MADYQQTIYEAKLFVKNLKKSSSLVKFHRVSPFVSVIGNESLKLSDLKSYFQDKNSLNINSNITEKFLILVVLNEMTIQFYSNNFDKYPFNFFYSKAKRKSFYLIC